MSAFFLNGLLLLCFFAVSFGSLEQDQFLLTAHQTQGTADDVTEASQVFETVPLILEQEAPADDLPTSTEISEIFETIPLILQQEGPSVESLEYQKAGEFLEESKADATESFEVYETIPLILEQEPVASVSAPEEIGEDTENQGSLSQNENTNKGLEVFENRRLVKIINFFRHGAHIDKALLYLDEYKSYNPQYPYFNQMTPLGNSQAWSYGNYLYKLYPNFIESIKEKEIDYTIKNLRKSYENALHIHAGLRQDIPRFNYESFDKTVLDALRNNGRCHGCDDLTKFPLDEILSHELANKTNSSEPELTIVEGDVLLDADNICVQVMKSNDEWFSFFYHKYLMEKDLVWEYGEFLKTVILNDNSRKIKMLVSHFHTVLWTIEYYHSQHNLPELDIRLERLKRIMNFETYKEFQYEFYSKVFGEDLEYAKFYTSELVKKSLEFLDQTEKKMKFFIVHDNNLGALGRLMFGEKGSGFIYSSSSIRFEVFENEDAPEDGLFVNGYMNNELLTLKDCDNMVNCPYLKFKEIMVGTVLDIQELCHL